MIINQKQVDQFLWDHRENGCVGVKGKAGFFIAWKDSVTGELIKIWYKESTDD